MTALTKEQIYEAVTDLAEESGMSADEYIASLIGQRESELLKRTEGLDEDIAFEIGESRRLKRENRSRERENARRAEMEEDISRFRTYFPDVAAKDIPEEVWAEVAQGVSLTHAYAQANPTYRVQTARARCARNLQILLHEGSWAMVSKSKSPAVHFVIRHEGMRRALESYCAGTT